MQALGVLDVRVSLKKKGPSPEVHRQEHPAIVTYHYQRPEDLARVAQEKQERERIEGNNALLVQFFNLDPTKVKKLEYETILLKRRREGKDVPEKGALLIYTDVVFRGETDDEETKVTLNLFADKDTHIPQELAIPFGFEAERKAADPDKVYNDIITPESEAYYEGMRAETQRYVALYEARITGATALRGFQEISGTEIPSIIPEQAA